MKALEDDADYKLKTLKENDMENKDIDAIKARIKKERITDMKEINYDKMREILRKLGLNKYFEHIQYILYTFNIFCNYMFKSEIYLPKCKFCTPSLLGTVSL